MNQLNARIILRNDGLAVWESNKTVVLARGEFGIAYDENNKARLKIGDGKTPWSDLEWFGGENNTYDVVTQEQLDALKEELDALAQRIGEPAGDDSDATGIYGEIAALAASMDSRIEEKLAIFETKLTDNGKIDTLMELINYVEEHGEETTALTGKVTALEGEVSDLNGSVIKEIAVNGVLVDVVNNRVDLTIDVAGTGVVSGDEIAVNEDGTLSIVSVDASKLITSAETTIVLNGGSASV